MHWLWHPKIKRDVGKKPEVDVRGQRSYPGFHFAEQEGPRKKIILTVMMAFWMKQTSLAVLAPSVEGTPQLVVWNWLCSLTPHTWASGRHEGTADNGFWPLISQGGRNWPNDSYFKARIWGLGRSPLSSANLSPNQKLGGQHLLPLHTLTEAVEEGGFQI